MSPMTFARKLISVFCITAFLLAAIHPVAPAILLALLVPFFFLVAPVENVFLSWHEDGDLPASPCLAIAGSRGPPNA